MHQPNPPSVPVPVPAPAAAPVPLPGTSHVATLLQTPQQPSVRFTPEQIKRIEREAAQQRNNERRGAQKVPDKSDAAAMSAFFSYINNAHNETSKMIQESEKVLTSLSDAGTDDNNNNDTIMGDETAHLKRSAGAMENLDMDNDDMDNYNYDDDNDDEDL